MENASFLQRPPAQVRRLDNGLTVVVREDRSAPVVAVVTHVRAGYFDEPDELVGISHVLEHMYFKGTARRGPGQIARETKEAGGYLNAGTIYDRTAYYTVLPAASFEQALDIQADALQNPVIDVDELRRELEVIIQEAKRKLDIPSAVARESLFATLFDRHRMRRWRIGTAEFLARFTRNDVLAFYHRYYRASNTTIVIVGDVAAERAFEVAGRCYAGMAAGAVERDRGPDEPPRTGFRFTELQGDIVRTLIEWGWRTPGTLHTDTPTLDVLAVALGQGRASRLYRHVRESGAVSAIGAWSYTTSATGVFGIGMELQPEAADAALGRTAAVLEDALERGFTDAEAARARAILEARLLHRLETMEGQASFLADWQAHGDWTLAQVYLDRVSAVTPAMLHDAARRYLTPANATVLAYRPHHTAPVQDVERAIFAGTEHGRPEPLAAQLLASPPGRVVRRRLEPLRIEDGVRFYDPGAGGARIVVKQRPGVPLVAVSLCVRGGSIAELDGSTGRTALMARTSVKGTQRRTAHQLAAETEALGGSIGTGAGADLLDWSLSMPVHQFGRGLELLLDAALGPAFPAPEAERERTLALADVARVRDDMQQYPLRLALAAAFRDHPYGMDVERLEAALRAVDIAALGAWHRERVLRGAPHIIIVGGIEDPDMTAALAADLLDGRLDTPARFEPPLPHWHGGTERIELRDRAQTAIVIAFPGPTRNHEDVYTLQVLSAAISGLGGRLFEELRSRRTLAYAVSAAPLPHWLGGAFIASIGTAPEREEEARVALLHELRATAERPLTAAELERAQRYLIGTWQIRQQTNDSQLDDLAAALLLGQGLVELNEYEARIRAVTAAAVQRAAERWLDGEHAVAGIVRGRRGT
jgi:zinc protease